MRAATLGTWYDGCGEGSRLLLNPESVGQPRRHHQLALAGAPADSRADYALLREREPGRWQYQLRRVSYAVARTAGALRALRWEGPPPAFSEPLDGELAADLAQVADRLPKTTALLASQLRLGAP